MLSEGEGCGSTFFFELPIHNESREVLNDDNNNNNKNIRGGKDSIEDEKVSDGNLFLECKSDSSIALKQRSSHRISPEENILDVGHEVRSVCHSKSYSEEEMATGTQCGLSSRYVDIIPSESSQNGKVIRFVEEAALENKMFQDPRLESKVLSVLLVDDAGSNRKMVRRVLDKSLFSPDEAEDGLVAVNKVAELIKSGEALYDVILMDFMMPNMNGPTATKQIRELGYKGMIIGVTGNFSPEDLDSFTASGADLVMHKPLDVTLLIANIRGICCVFIVG